MSRQRRNIRPPLAPQPKLLAPRRRLGGQVAAVVWYLGGFALLLAGARTQTGPYAWAAAWQQQQHFGHDTVLFSFLPGFLLLLAPLVILNRLPHRPDRPFLLGAQEAIWPSPGSTRRAVPVGTQAERLRRISRGMAGLAVASLLGGGFGCWWALRPGPQPPGSPLPEVELAAVADVPLPPYTRITGAVPRPDRAWVHDYGIRLTSYHDVFTPSPRPAGGTATP